MRQRRYYCLKDWYLLDWHALRQLLDSHARPRGLVREVFSVHTVHLGKVVHGCDEDCDLRVIRISIL
jgi:hypothetical protein